MPPGTALLSDAEIEADLDAALARHPPDEDVWLFGYGSLMWNPAIEYAERRAGSGARLAPPVLPVAARWAAARPTIPG